MARHVMYVINKLSYVVKQEKGQLESQLQEVATLAMAFIKHQDQSDSSSTSHTTVQERQIVDTAFTDVSPTTSVEPLEDEISAAVAEALEPKVPSAKLRRDAAAAIYDGLRHRQAAVKGGKENIAPVASTSRLPPGSCRPSSTSGTAVASIQDQVGVRTGGRPMRPLPRRAGSSVVAQGSASAERAADGTEDYDRVRIAIQE
ncbi:hypothetical protein JR316_0007776 [Psilocybe cubensis]|uniref:Uncharacterized protein n=2 Tax=Psilocybe cubensis TaxID=181762 RepID=A0ACB8GUN1_PSICU|nr:hypothetical protein JR316_0007776 [Psilocybe cubensis]KAH9479190.1 hypothetical protein JR316_0007776 [Psilocybe cubensis]